MGRFQSRYKAVYLTLAFLLASPAMAEVPELAPLNYQLKYDITWNAMPIGRIRLSATEDRFRYQITVDTKTRGIVRLFDKTVSVISANGRFVDGEAVAIRYESKSTDDDSTKTTLVTYEEDGTIKTRERNPPDDPLNRPPVPIEQANAAFDPITAMFRLRKMLHDNIARNQRDAVLRTYDGARLADFTFKVISRARIKLGDDYVDAINTVMVRKPIAGYKEKELKKYREGDPTIHVYFSPDARMLPLMAEIDLPLGMISARLTETKEIKK